jgi:ankyrin repeat protein
MAAVLKGKSIRQQVLDDARWGTGEAWLEPFEVPQWLAEAGDHDIVHGLAEALSDIDDDQQNAKLCALLDLLCEKGEDIAQSKAVELLETLRSSLTGYCVKQAQKMVDEELVA